MNPCVASLLAGAERLPAVELEIDDARALAQVRVGTSVVAHIGLDRADALVSAPADTIETLHRLFPSSRPTSTGIIFDLSVSPARSEALAAITRRVAVQRLMPQFRAASP
jgi:hypothetical protein